MSNTIFKRTKILATVGPATMSQDKISQLMQAGVNGFRLNFSHGSYDEQREQMLALAVIMSVTPWDKIDPGMSPFVNLFSMVGFVAAAGAMN